jgi:hypothetical protein
MGFLAVREHPLLMPVSGLQYPHPRKYLGPLFSTASVMRWAAACISFMPCSDLGISLASHAMASLSVVSLLPSGRVTGSSNLRDQLIGLAL